ncbi:exopolygalacturonase-like [Cucurbita moschata]|uniref:Exopolygalacturonase-like n=1 Tax=Cucurbita moschata TaxID=3662 RepID=A0A6J1EPV8_CUCMO|nr:exopolygalacturonase-like [Cucurbita moschata]
MSTIKSSFLAATILMLLLLVVTVDAQSSADVVFPFKRYGNIVSGTDIRKTLANAWKDACTSNRSSAIFTPRGIFKVKQGKFEGPCNSPIDFQLGGTLQAPKSVQGYNWITFARVDRLTLLGEGVFHGQGKAAWKRNDCHKRINSAQLPVTLENAWKDACTSNRSSAIFIPRGIFTVKQGNFEGPYNSPIDFQLGGTLQAPKSVQGDNWITFARVDRLTLLGEEVFHGQGKAAWKRNDCHKRRNSAQLLVSLRFNFITNSTVKGITSLDSKNFHINVLGCNNLTFHNINIAAPEKSPNTDGIHIGRSNNITITKSKIATGDDCISLGDDCISLGDESKLIEVTNVTCGPGHGISIRSLGRYTNEEPVEGVIVKNCTLVNTTNGVRIKTWPASAASSTATNMHFLDIIMVNVSNPILIDQEYCPCNRQIPSKIKISTVSFKNIRGSSATPLAIKLICSHHLLYDDVKVSNLDLTYNGIKGSICSQCSNVKPIISGKQNPKICSSPYVVR